MILGHDINLNKYPTSPTPALRQGGKKLDYEFPAYNPNSKTQDHPIQLQDRPAPLDKSLILEKYEPVHCLEAQPKYDLGSNESWFKQHPSLTPAKLKTLQQNAVNAGAATPEKSPGEKSEAPSRCYWSQETCDLLEKLLVPPTFPPVREIKPETPNPWAPFDRPTKVPDSEQLPLRRSDSK